MCLALVNRKSELPKEYFLNAAEANGDGMGLLCVHEGRLIQYKTLDVEDFYTTYIAIRRGAPEFDIAPNTMPILLHWRMATHGVGGTFNCHPFMVNDKVGFIHNGVFNGMPSDLELSDTQVFNEKVLKALPYNVDDLHDKGNFLNCDALRDLLFDYCDKNYSKLAFLEADGSVSIFNAKAGINDTEGNWFSNSSYKPRYGYQSQPYNFGDQWNRTKPVAPWAQSAYSKSSVVSAPAATQAQTSDSYEYTGEPDEWDEYDSLGEDGINPLGVSKSGSFTSTSTGINLRKLANRKSEDNAYQQQYEEVKHLGALYIDDEAAINGIDHLEHREIERRFTEWHDEHPLADTDDAWETIDTIILSVLAPQELQDVVINMEPVEQDRQFAAALACANNQVPAYGAD